MEVLAMSKSVVFAAGIYVSNSRLRSWRRRQRRPGRAGLLEGERRSHRRRWAFWSQVVPLRPSPGMLSWSVV